MKYIPPDRIAKAREMDLLTYLMIAEPEELVKLSPYEYSTKTHDSLKISHGKWHQWSTGHGGSSALDYLTDVKGVAFLDAVHMIEELTGTDPSFFDCQKAQRQRKAAEKQPFILPERNTDQSRVISYLISRGIDRDIVLELVGSGRIYQSKKYGNAVFVGIDTNGQPKHAAVRATDSRRFMYDVGGSDKRFSFSLVGAEDSRTVHIFESAIDLLSYCTMVKRTGYDWKASHKLSLSGVAESGELPMSLEQYLKDHPTVTTACLHLDNDEAGRKASAAISNLLEARDIEVTDSPPPAGKDMNEYLQKIIRHKERSSAR